MAGNLGWFDPELVPIVLGDSELNTTIGLYDPEWADLATAAFDASLMRAMDRSWPDIIWDSPQLVAAGMTPPDFLPS